MLSVKSHPRRVRSVHGLAAGCRGPSNRPQGLAPKALPSPSPGAQTVTDHIQREAEDAGSKRRRVAQWEKHGLEYQLCSFAS